MNKTRQKTYFNTIILVFIVIGLFYVGDSYLATNIKKTSAEIISKKQELKKLEEQNNRIEIIRTGYKNMQQEMNEVSELIVDYSQIINFIIELENTAKKNNIDLTISVYDKEGDSIDKNLSYVGYNIKAAGSFDNLMRFLLHIENLKYFNNVKNLKMSYSNEQEKKYFEKKENDSDKIIMNAKLDVYVKNRKIK